MIRALGWVLRRDLLLAFRRRGDVVNALVFFVIVVSLFPLGVGPEASQLRNMAPGVLWVAALLACMLSLARLFAPFRERGLPVLMHSDGQIQKILPDLVEIGLTTLNPVQPEVLEHKWLHANFHRRLSFYGGISTQTVLPSGTPDQVTAAVAQCARDLAPDGTGLLIGPSHRMLTDIPMENVAALLEGFRVLGQSHA